MCYVAAAALSDNSEGGRRNSQGLGPRQTWLTGLLLLLHGHGGHGEGGALAAAAGPQAPRPRPRPPPSLVRCVPRAIHPRLCICFSMDTTSGWIFKCYA